MQCVPGERRSPAVLLLALMHTTTKADGSGPQLSAPGPHPTLAVKTIPCTAISPLPALALYSSIYSLMRLSGHWPEPRGLLVQSNQVKHSPSLAGFEWKSTEWKRHVLRGQSGKAKKAGEARSMNLFSPPIPHSQLTGYKAEATAGGAEFYGCLFGPWKVGGRETFTDKSEKTRSKTVTLHSDAIAHIYLPVIALERFWKPAMQSQLQRKPANDLGNLTVVNISARTHAISWALIGTSQLTSFLGGGARAVNWLHCDIQLSIKTKMESGNFTQEPFPNELLWGSSRKVQTVVREE